MSEPVDITMTAVLRPEITAKTLETFCKHVFVDRDRYRLIVNIDPVGNATPMSVVRLCKGYFNNVVYNVAGKPSFSKAVMWIWKQVTAKFIFHLEDDWIIYRDLDIDHMIYLMRVYPELASLRLSRKLLSMRKKDYPILKVDSLIYTHKYGEKFFVAHDRGRSFSLNPSLIKTKFIKKALPFMVEERNPEKQFRSKDPSLGKYVVKWDHGIYGDPNEDPYVFGRNGARWRDSQGFQKPSKNTFLTWEKKK